MSRRPTGAPTSALAMGAAGFVAGGAIVRVARVDPAVALRTE